MQLAQKLLGLCTSVLKVGEKMASQFNQSVPSQNAKAKTRIIWAKGLKFLCASFSSGSWNYKACIQYKSLCC